VWAQTPVCDQVVPDLPSVCWAISGLGVPRVVWEAYSTPQHLEGEAQMESLAPAETRAGEWFGECCRETADWKRYSTANPMSVSWEPQTVQPTWVDSSSPCGSPELRGNERADKEGLNWVNPTFSVPLGPWPGDIQ